MVARGHEWLPGGHAWLRGACMVAGVMHGYWGTCMVTGGMRVWLLGACMVAEGMHSCGGHVWLPEGVCGCQGACMVVGGMHGCRGGIRRARLYTVNERAVRILLECILVTSYF